MYLRKLINLIGIPLLILVSLISQAQERVISGAVTDASGKGVPGVSVTVKGQTRGTTTTESGAYSISVPASAKTLIFTSVGYSPIEMDIAGRSSVNVTLSTATGNLNEVVVVGYGTQRKRDLTGSISTVTAKDFQKGSITTPEQLIAGKVAGVSIISNGGQPGSGSQIRIRGGSSLIASNDPLIVLDGVPLDPGGISGGNNPLSFINPNDIESFTILKDASSAAIYGTRAANGVIIINTKKGRAGATRVSFSTVNSASQIIKTVDVLSAEQVRDIVNKLGNTTQKAQIGKANTNWQNEIYQTALATDNNISLTGGIKGLPYRLSYGYLNQQGVLKTDHLERNSLSLNLSPVVLNGSLKIDLNLKGTISKYRFANQGAIGTAVYYDPTQPIYSNTPQRFGGYFEWMSNGIPNTLAARNPLALLYDRHDNSDAQRSIGNVQFDYKIPFLPDLHANLNLGYDVSKGTGTIVVSDSSSLEYIDPHTPGYLGAGENNHYKQTKENRLLEFYLNYVKDLSSSMNSRLDLMAGYSFNNYKTTNYSYPSYYFNGKEVPNTEPTYLFSIPENTLISYFGRANLSLQQFLLTATIRRDASSRFGPANRWGTFPSVALAWKIKDESFLKSNQAVSDLKLRVGYGITGQQEGIGLYDYLSYYSLSNTSAEYQLGNTFYQMYRPGGFYANRKWEQTATTNVGVDFGFLNNRISGSIDVYQKKTSDLLNSVPQPAGTNFSAYVVANVGDMKNEGVEFNINTQPVRHRDLTWDVTYNITYNKNTITNLTVIPDDPNYAGFPSTNINGVQGFAFLNAVGTSKNTFYLYHQVYDQNGKPIEGLFEDVNRDGIINEKDKYLGKRADPNVFMGFSTNLTKGKWNAGFVMRASFNNYVYNNIYSNNGRLNQLLGAQTTGNASVNYLETGFVGNTEQQLLSDYYLQNASFLRMDNLNIGYNFGPVIRNAGGLRASFTVQNVFTITKYTGLDPEIGNGVDDNLYPRPRIYSLGLNLDF
jgi:TonB-dependent starch-binding outer membrane protein SusC